MSIKKTSIPLQINQDQINQDRRKLIQGVACVGVATGVASFAPAALGLSSLDGPELTISGKLICKIFDPIKTLVLHNQTTENIIIDRFSHGAFMYDGGIVDCSAACLSNPITMQPNQEIEVQFDKRKQVALTHSIDEFHRIQSRVLRLHDGTRVIPFTATVLGRVAVIA